MHDRPNSVELVAAVRQYLETELVPTLVDARLKFQTLIAANVLAIVERELATEETHLAQEWQWLHDLLDSAKEKPQGLAALKEAVRQANVQLCERMRRGDFDSSPRSDALMRLLRRQVERKLEIANPRYLAGFNAGVKE